METIIAGAAIALGTVATVFALLLSLAVCLFNEYAEEPEVDEDSTGDPDQSGTARSPFPPAHSSFS